MAVQLSPVADQVIVITGASSGIGLATARRAASAGASVVLVSRNGAELERIAREIRQANGQAIAVPADVARLEDVERVSQRTVQAFGGFDSWVNNAAVSVYGTLEQIPLEDHRRVFDVNYWGVVYGSLVAARHLRAGPGGAIVNVGSILSDRAAVLQGPYSAAKHAVKAFTEAFRNELDHDKAPISVTLIKPSAIDTPFFEHARSYLDAPGVRHPPPAYHPDLVADAILHACETPTRTLAVGFGGYAQALFASHFPHAADKIESALGFDAQKREDPGRVARRDNLYQPREDGSELSSYPGGQRRTSLFLEAQKRPAATAVILTALGAGLAGVLARRRPRSGGADAHEPPRIAAAPERSEPERRARGFVPNPSGELASGRPRRVTDRSPDLGRRERGVEVEDPERPQRVEDRVDEGRG